MKSTARSRRHKTVEPIDFRELLDAPALNGLKEALAHRRESEADVPQFPSPPAIPPGQNESTAVELTASESVALESTAGKYGAVQVIAAKATSTNLPEFRQPPERDKSDASESTAPEVDARDFSALESGRKHAPDRVEDTAANSTARERPALGLLALTSQALQNQTNTRTKHDSGAFDAVNPEAVNSTAFNPSAVELTATDLGTLDIGFLDESALGRRTGRRTFNVQPATRIETIFSPSELKVLNWMWSRGRAVDRVSMARLVTASNGEGMRRLAIHFGVAYTTFRNLVRSLSTKLAVEIVKQETTHPAIYLVYHYSAILQRLRRAGLTGVVHKGSNAWVLVDANTQPAAAQPELTLQELKRKLIALKTNAVQITALASSDERPTAGDSNALKSWENQPDAVESDAVLPDSTAVKSAAPIRNKEYPSGREFPSPPPGKSNAPKSVIDALFERTQRTDADAARSITSSCTTANPTVTHDEIARLIREFQIPPTISNPVGLLIRTLATRCEPESLERYRRHWETEDLQAARFKLQQQQENERIARMILEDPDISESEREWARDVLGG